MRTIITGVDASGRSCVASEFELEQAQDPLDVKALFRTYSSPPNSRPKGSGVLNVLGLPPGHLQWQIVRWAPRSPSDPPANATMHHTDTIDLDLVLDGSIDLVLGDGPHRLDVGDCAVVVGIDHGWIEGPGGCTLSVVLLGTPDRPNDS